MVINHVPANAPSHMRQTIGLESAAACTSMYDGSHPWANDGPIFVVVWEIPQNRFEFRNSRIMKFPTKIVSSPTERRITGPGRLVLGGPSSSYCRNSGI